ncbi:MAG TPA: hypothetical protein VFJ29_03710 [Candidatus Kapabacteria bacterium]|nr:hypothetical protein [Candidatus Kapabacteria bacterium]
MNKPFRYFLFTLLALAVLSCNHGLNPADSVINSPKQTDSTSTKLTGISGLVTFRGTFPPADSLLELRAVALYRKYPLDSLVNAFANGQAFFSDTLPFHADTTSYTIYKNLTPGVPVTPHEYDYIVVALRYGANYFSDWRAVGVYSLSGNDSLPSSVIVLKDSVIGGVNMTVDYDHLPPQ